MSSVVQVLTQARNLIEKPESWTRGVYARDSSGEETNAHEDARSFCSIGAIAHAARVADDPGKAEWDGTGALRAAVAIGPLTEWNDATDRTHAEVLAAFDRAIALAEAQ